MTWIERKDGRVVLILDYYTKQTDSRMVYTRFTFFSFKIRCMGITISHDRGGSSQCRDDCAETIERIFESLVLF
jgi:hypothetical protein